MEKKGRVGGRGRKRRRDDRVVGGRMGGAVGRWGISRGEEEVSVLGGGVCGGGGGGDGSTVLEEGP